MHIMLTTTCPPDKTVEVATRYVKVQQENPLPPFIKTVGVFVTSSLESGTKTYLIYELEAGKENEGLQEIGRRIVPFMDIEGYRYHIEPVFPAEEAISMLPL